MDTLEAGVHKPPWSVNHAEIVLVSIINIDPIRDPNILPYQSLRRNCIEFFRLLDVEYTESRQYIGRVGGGYKETYYVP